MDIKVLNKETNVVETMEINKFLYNGGFSEQENYSYSLYENIYIDTIYDIWKRYNQPFIAEDINGWFVLIYTNPYEQYKKYRAVYGRQNKKIKALLSYDNSQEIRKAGERTWRLVALKKNFYE